VKGEGQASSKAKAKAKVAADDSDDEIQFVDPAAAAAAAAAAEKAAGGGSGFGGNDAGGGGNDDDEELSIVGSKGKNALMDYPHSRFHCTAHPFAKGPHSTHCDNCYCFVWYVPGVFTTHALLARPPSTRLAQALTNTAVPHTPSQTLFLTSPYVLSPSKPPSLPNPAPLHASRSPPLLSFAPCFHPTHFYTPYTIHH
jgi:hypothetical protein